MARKKRVLVLEAETPTPKYDQDNCNTDEALKQEIQQSIRRDLRIGKSREWTCLVYPDSAPENWKEILQKAFLETYISPLHDRDLNPDGTPKKPHYHVVLAWQGPTTYSNACEIAKEFGGIVEPRVVGSLRGICRYLCHLDNPEKAQYNPDDVICYNGADWDLVINLKSDKYRSLEEMMDFCNKYKITAFPDLNTYARAKRKADWFRTLCDSGAYIMREYCKSLQWQLENNGHIRDINEIEEIMRIVEEREENKYESNN